MVKNKHIKVETENGKSVFLSAGVIVTHLKNYTSDWGNLSSEAQLDAVEDTFPKSTDDSMNVFNQKIGYVAPRVMLNSLIDDVVALLKDEKPEYLVMFQSFNNLEKLAIYFILMITKDRTISEVFSIINSNSGNLSKRDLLIKLLSEVTVDETDDAIADPINGLYRLISSAATHKTKTPPSFEFGTGKIDFQEFTFPMHSYNTTKRFGWIKPIANAGVRNYYERFDTTWVGNKPAIAEWASNITSPLYKTTPWKTILTDNVASAAGGTLANAWGKWSTYRKIFEQISYKEVYFNSREEKPLFKYLGEHFFDFSTSENYSAYSIDKSPLTMRWNLGPSPSHPEVDSYLNRGNLSAGAIAYSNSTPGIFNDLKTLLSYYASDISFWLTSDASTNNTAYSDYLHTQTNTSFLTSNGKSETKGYFSNAMFIQSAIQNILYPRILKSAQDGYTSSDDIFYSDPKIYDTIFDSIVNNGFVYTDSANEDVAADVMNDNYEIIPNRVILDTKTGVEAVDFTNCKSTNLYEFLINNLIISKTNVNADSSRKIVTASDMENFTRQSLLYKGGAINYNPTSSKVTKTTDSLTVADFDSNTIVYDFKAGDVGIYDPTPNDWFTRINGAFYKMSDDSYSKINYRDIKFFKIPVHSSDPLVTSSLNRNIQRVDRELLTDISDLANYDIEGLSLADFTYGEKALLKEYINNYRAIKRKLTLSDFAIVKDMLKELDDLVAWKSSPSTTLSSNSYHKAADFPMQIGNAVYFPELLSTNDINSIKAMLNRSILSISKNRASTSDGEFVEQAKELIKNSAVDIKFTTEGAQDDRVITLNSVSTYFLTALKLIVSSIKKTDEYDTAFGAFNTAYQSGNWINIVASLEDVKAVLLDEALISTAIEENDIYSPSKNQDGILRDLDMALYRLVITNYFNYISDTDVLAETKISKVVFIDNATTGVIRYYSDMVSLIKFADKYHTLVPQYVQYLTTNVLTKYYSKINAIKSLPTWDYESFHRRDRESDLKIGAGTNIHDYNIVWSSNTSGLKMVYKGTSGTSSYRVSGSLYAGGGLSYAENNYAFRDRWWRKWLTNGSEAFSHEIYNISMFKVPSVNVIDNNIPLPSTWEYNNPNSVGKAEWFNKMRFNTETYVQGKVANITSFKYSDGATRSYENIGVPLLLLGDDGSEWNKANTIRENSFSFETEFLNLWFTDEGYSDGGIINHGGAEAYTSRYELVSGADKYRYFGLGRMDIQEMFKHLWNMESSPMGNPYTVMNYDVFSTWDDGYQVDLGDFPWSTEGSKVSNKYDFKFVLMPCYREGIWSPVRLSGENRVVGVDADITNDQIHANFYLTSTKAFTNAQQLSTAIFDIYNRNFRNRVYLAYLKWRFYNSEGVW